MPSLRSDPCPWLRTPIWPRARAHSPHVRARLAFKPLSCPPAAAQAISQLRQKKLDDAVKSVNNLLACDRALPAERPVQEDERADLQDLFSAYLSRVRLRSTGRDAS